MVSASSRIACSGGAPSQRGAYSHTPVYSVLVDQSFCIYCARSTYVSVAEMSYSISRIDYGFQLRSDCFLGFKHEVAKTPRENLIAGSGRLDVLKAHANLAGGFISRMKREDSTEFPSRGEGASEGNQNGKHSGVLSGRVVSVRPFVRQFRPLKGPANIARPFVTPSTVPNQDGRTSQR